MLNQLLQSYRDYEAAKEKAAEKTVNVFESKTNPLFVVLFLTLTISAWIFAIFIPVGFEQLYNACEFYPLIIFFIFTYFSFFLGSKFIIKPNAEELSDDTSIFAVFSACGRKEMRGLISIGLGLLHTSIFALYLVNKDLHFF